MQGLRLFMAGMFAVALVPLGAGAASAAVPDNDESPGARVLNLGDHVTQDTTEATTNAGDDALNANCGAPATGNSVWYQFTPSLDRNVAIDVSLSDYSAGLMVFQGTPTADSLVACGPGVVGVPVLAGTTYSVMAFEDSGADPDGPRDLDLRLRTAPTPVVHVAVAKGGVAYHRGAAKIHGTYSCRHAGNFAGLDAHLLQLAGRLKIQGDGGTGGVTCDGTRHGWSVRVVSSWGTYARGYAVARASIFACGFVECSTASVRRRVHLGWATGSGRWMGNPTTGLTLPRATVPMQTRWPSSAQ